MAASASIASILQRQVAALSDGQVFTIMVETQTEAAYFKALSRMVGSGKLVRILAHYDPQKRKL